MLNYHVLIQSNLHLLNFKIMRTLKLIFFTMLICLSANSLAANAPGDNLTKIIANRFSKLWYYTPQEKVYLHSDKPYYSAGEEIWFKAYLVNASTHKPNTKSQFIYVELIDNSDSVITRVKIRKDSLTGFDGNIKLSPEIQEGTYNLRAYTYWMQNVPVDFFYSKNIFIGNNIDDRINCEAKYGTPIGGKIPVNITFSNAFKKPLSGKNVTISQSWIKTNKKKLLVTTSTDGKVNLQLLIDSTDKSKKFLELYMKEPGVKFRNKLYIPEFGKNFDIQFFPESGNLLNDHLQNMGFKAVAKDGLSVEVSGTLFNNNNEEVTQFSSMHKGMGRIVFKTNPGESYYAIVKSADGIEKRVDIPVAQTKGVALHISYNRGKLIYQLMNSTNVPSDSLYMLIHSRGVVYVVLPFTSTEGQIPEAILPGGIASFSVIDSIGNTYCERLFFIRNFQTPTVAMIADKPKYGKRAPVSIDFNVQTASGKPVEGNFSVSITDSKSVQPDSLADNILNNLLLTSDLKGYIEDPGTYFVDNSNTTREKTDLLMLTQGWRRFNTADFVKGKNKIPEYYLEAGQTISGKVLNVLGKPSKDRDVIMMVSYKNRISTTKTDSLGKFLIDGIEFPDSTNILLKAKSKTKIVDVELIWDKDEFPKANVFIPYRQGSNTPPADYFNISKDKYYTEGGLRIYNLDEFTVTGAKKPLDPQDAMYSSLADYGINSERLEDLMGLGILDILATVPGVEVNGQEISIRGGGQPLYVVDGIETDRIDDILYLNTTDIEGIYVFKGVSTTMFGSRGGNGVIAITLKKGASRTSSLPASSMMRVKPLGFQKPAEFYVPKYDIDSVRMLPKADLRTTVYWNPKLTTDITGNMKISFYTADAANDYNITLEGIGKNGEICRFKGKLRRQN